MEVSKQVNNIHGLKYNEQKCRRNVHAHKRCNYYGKMRHIAHNYFTRKTYEQWVAFKVSTIWVPKRTMVTNMILANRQKPKVN